MTSGEPAGENHEVPPLLRGRRLGPQAGLDAADRFRIPGFQVREAVGERGDLVDRIEASPAASHVMGVVLHEIEVARTAGTEDHGVTVVKGLSQDLGVVVPPPEDQGSVQGQVASSIKGELLASTVYRAPARSGSLQDALPK